MSSWALLGGLMGGAQAAQTLLLDKSRQMQKDKDEADQQALWTKRQYLMESLKAPAEKTETIDDPDNPGHKITVVSRWNPPTQDGQKGSYQEVSRVHVPVNMVKDKISLPGNKEQDVMIDPTTGKVINQLGAARDIFDPSSKARLGIEGANLSLAQQRLALEGKRFDTDTSLKVKELADKQAERLDAKNNAQHERYSFHEQDDPTTPSGKKGYKFDKFTGDFNPVGSGNGIKPGGGLVAEMGQQNDPGEFAPSSSPLSQLAPPSAKGASSAFPAASGTQQQGGGHGAVVRRAQKNGQVIVQYADGTWLPG